MKRTWISEELLEHFILLPDELRAISNKSGVTRLGFVVLFKCFQYEGRFLRSRQEAAPGYPKLRYRQKNPPLHGFASPGATRSACAGHLDGNVSVHVENSKGGRPREVQALPGHNEDVETIPERGLIAVL
jgi:Domain of unknown function (DUF4158)